MPIIARKLPWYERRAGYCTAIPTVALALLILNLIPKRQREPEPPIPAKVLVVYEQEELPPPPVPTPPEPEPPPPEPPKSMEVAATRKDSQEDGEEVLDPVTQDKMPESVSEQILFVDPVPPSQPVAIEDWIPTREDAAELRAIKERIDLKESHLEASAQQLKEFIIREEVKSAAKNFEYDTDGGITGAVRTLRMNGFPLEVQRQVLERYGIKFDHRYTKPSAGRSFLNAAETDQGRFTNTQAEGYYDVFVLSPMALNLMTRMEVQAMYDRGFQTSDSRVRKVVFGIVLEEDGSYALGVVDIEIERIP